MVLATTIIRTAGRFIKRFVQIATNLVKSLLSQAEIVLCIARNVLQSAEMEVLTRRPLADITK